MDSNLSSATFYMWPWANDLTSGYLIPSSLQKGNDDDDNFSQYSSPPPPLYSMGIKLLLHVYISFPTLCSVAIWASRHSSQCYSAGSPCQSHSILKRNKVKGHKVISQGLTYGRQVKHTLFLPFNPITVCKHRGLLHQWFSNVSVGVRNTCDAGYK